MDFTLNLSIDELRDRTSPDRLKAIHLIDEDFDRYSTLDADDKMVLCHLVRAGQYIDIVDSKLNNVYNLPFLEYLENNIDDEACRLTRELFLAQKSIVGVDNRGNSVILTDVEYNHDGLGFYPQDLSIEEFHTILGAMLDDGLVDDVRSIFTVRSVVVRSGQYLKGVDYVDYFRDEFCACADELEQAIPYCKDKDFAKYLTLQAKALREANPTLDAYADIQWSSLDKCKFEFTITRESYDDKMSISVLDNPTLKARLDALGIVVYAKDNLGARIGIVNEAGTELIHKLSHSVDIARALMPYSSEYQSTKSSTDTKQTVVDVDLIALFGDVGAYNGGITIAENLPNVDKLSLSMGGGNRNVYHRQIRLSKSEKRAEMLLSDLDKPYFDLEASHWMTICHENTHSLGPDGAGLGKYSHIVEELKADMGAYAFLREFVAEGVFSLEDAHKIVVTGVCDSFLLGKPKMSQAHRVRSVMIVHRYMLDGAVVLDDSDTLHIDYDKVIDSSKAMLADMVRLQLDASVSKAKDYVDKYFQWTDSIARVADILTKNSKVLSGKLVEPLKDKMLSESFSVK